MDFTIFTPTYNRADKLHQLYQSLCNQKSNNFEWLIIDDGSMDSTADVVRLFISENKIHIRYIWQKNGGKHRAFNRAIEEANSKWFVCIDSDDYLTPNAMVDMELYGSIVEKELNLSGFVGVCVSKSGCVLGRIPQMDIISDTIDIRDKYHIWGEPEIYKTSILKNYRFPCYEGEKFITEAVVFDVLTLENKLLYTNRKLMVKEYLRGGLTENQLAIRINSLNGTLFYYHQRFLLSKKWFYKLRALINYKRFYFHAANLNKAIDAPKISFANWVLPFAFLLFMSDKRKNSLL